MQIINPNHAVKDSARPSKKETIRIHFPKALACRRYCQLLLWGLGHYVYIQATERFPVDFHHATVNYYIQYAE